MDKYGVELDEETSAVAKTTGECPSCKAQLEQKDPPHCSNCGSLPFEKTSAAIKAMLFNGKVNE